MGCSVAIAAVIVQLEGIHIEILNTVLIAGLEWMEKAMKRTKDDIITDIVDLQSAVNLALRSAANSDFHLVDNHMLDVTKAVHKVEIDLDLLEHPDD